MSEKEVLKVFNAEYESIGTATREQIHQQGLWHETFHCWFYELKADDLIIYFQKRARTKKDFPGMLDITAAGHLLAAEQVADGFREVEEELGIKIMPEQAESLGVFIVEIALDGFIDNEFTNVFLVRQELAARTFLLQEEEVEGLFPITLTSFKQLFKNEVSQLSVEGLCQQDGQQFSVVQTVRMSDFCANARSYYEQLLAAFEKILENHSKTLDYWK
ncbi:NUDIX hydrolase [Enterococcus sp. LJL51]|uniref:NUDIX hydrolase n=1 Tax=Enterococcus sp. LJL51 TaxID=3416656 RepID=UPI003CED311F